MLSCVRVVTQEMCVNKDIACVASVSSRVIARNLEREQKKMEGGGGREGGNPPPSFLFLLSFQFSRRTRAEPLATQANKDKSQFPKQEDTNGSD